MAERMGGTEQRAAFYRNQIERAGQRAVQQRRIEARYPWARLAGFVAGVAATILAFQAPAAWAGWLALFLSVAVFALLAYGHRRVIESITRYDIVVETARRQLARLELDWLGIPTPPDGPRNPGHPFELDLNLTGERSLHQLIDTAVSTGGSARLRGWLLALAPEIDQTLHRQALLRELLPRYGFRARLALAGAVVMRDPNERWDGEKLLRWLDSHANTGSLRPLLIALGALAVVNAALFVLSMAGLIPAVWPFGILLFWGIQTLKYREMSDLFEEAYGLSRSLDTFRAVLAELEGYPCPHGGPLAELCQPFSGAGRQRPSRLLRRLSRIVSAASLRANPFLSLILNSVLPWDLYFTYRLEQYKATLRGVLPAWLDAWYELEALLSLANFAYLNPSFTFPEIACEGEYQGQVFEGQGLGHPLIAQPVRVANDFSVPGLGQIAIITGSNMSGKSTFLRTLGVNVCLANAGSVVCAAQLRLVPFRLFTCINVTDSLNDGISYFYAEVRRLKALLDALRQPEGAPLFYLIDEIFRGTNNRERRVGSLSYVRALAGGRGVGMISTHDLELVHLAEEIPGIRNFHFREEVCEGRMIFDYAIHSGPSPTTNALKIMAIEGLPVDEQGAPTDRQAAPSE